MSLTRLGCNITYNQACEFGISPYSHTWLPYLAPKRGNDLKNIEVSSKTS